MRSRYHTQSYLQSSVLRLPRHRSGSREIRSLLPPLLLQKYRLLHPSVLQWFRVLLLCEPPEQAVVSAIAAASVSETARFLFFITLFLLILLDRVVQIFIFDVLILQFRINNVNVVCAFCSPSWFLHGFHLFYLHDLLHSHKVFSYVCVILRHGGSWARKLRRQFFNKRSSCHKNPVIIKKPPCSRFQKHDGIVSSLQFLIMSDKLNFIVVSFIHLFIFFCQELEM